MSTKSKLINNNQTLNSNNSKLIVIKNAFLRPLPQYDGDIPSSGVDTSDATATQSDILLGKTAYVNGTKLIGTHVCPTTDNSIDTSDATAKASNIETGYDAYVNGAKVEGTLMPPRDYSTGIIDGTLTEIYNSEVTKIRSKVFLELSYLTSVNFPNVTSIEDSAFRYCTKLTDIYLGYEGIVSLSSTDAFDNGASNTRLHVKPNFDLTALYASATNWSSLIASGRITIVEDYVE